MCWGSGEEVGCVPSGEIVDESVHVGFVGRVDVVPRSHGNAVDFAWVACISTNWLVFGSRLVAFEHS